jgi:hypothetical protein
VFCSAHLYLFISGFIQIGIAIGIEIDCRAHAVARNGECKGGGDSDPDPDPDGDDTATEPRNARSSPPVINPITIGAFSRLDKRVPAR